jgi:hypothetical protein
MSERRQLPSQMTVEQLRERAAEYRKMAETARARGSVDGLLRLAERYEAMAEGWGDAEGGERDAARPDRPVTEGRAPG